MACMVLPDVHEVLKPGADGDMLAAVNPMGLLDKLTPEVLQAQRGDLAQAQFMVVDCNLPAQTLAGLLQSPTQPVFADAVSVAKCEKLRPGCPACNCSRSISAKRLC